MGIYRDRVLPRLIDIALGNKEIEQVRARVAGKLSGEVLEIGFGSGRNVAHYSPDVTRVHAVEPSPGARRLAQPRIAAGSTPVDWVGLDGQTLTLPDESVDNVLVTWTLCTIPDVERALAEMHRVLRPEGRLHFVEHGRSGFDDIARRQDRIDPWWGKVAGGCHLNRPIPDLIRRAGFRIGPLEKYQLEGPSWLSTTFEGTASKR